MSNMEYLEIPIDLNNVRKPDDRTLDEDQPFDECPTWEDEIDQYERPAAESVLYPTQSTMPSVAPPPPIKRRTNWLTGLVVFALLGIGVACLSWFAADMGVTRAADQVDGAAMLGPSLSVGTLPTERFDNSNSAVALTDPSSEETTPLSSASASQMTSKQSDPRATRSRRNRKRAKRATNRTPPTPQPQVQTSQELQCPTDSTESTDGRCAEKPAAVPSPDLDNSAQVKESVITEASNDRSEPESIMDSIERAVKRPVTADDEIDQLIGTAVAPPPKPAAITAKPSANELFAQPATASKRTTLTKSQVRSALTAVAAAVSQCGKGQSGQVRIKLAIRGATGRVIEARPVIGDAHRGTPLGLCAARRAKLAKFPKFDSGVQVVEHDFKF